MALGPERLPSPGQRVLKCQMDGRIVAFMVVEQPTPASRFWSLVGLAPGLAGKGLGRRVWQAVLAFHHREGRGRGFHQHLIPQRCRA